MAPTRTWLVAVGILVGCGPKVSPDSESCDMPEPLTQRGTEVPSGYERCEDGLEHRVEPVACELPDDTVGDCMGMPNPDGTISRATDRSLAASPRGVARRTTAASSLVARW